MEAELNYFAEMQRSAKGKWEGKVMRYSDWMSQLPPALHNIPLYNLAIPGMKLN